MSNNDYAEGGEMLKSLRKGELRKIANSKLSSMRSVNLCFLPKNLNVEEGSMLKNRRLPTISADNPNSDATWRWLSFGKNKAKAIVKFFDAIKKSGEE